MGFRCAAQGDTGRNPRSARGATTGEVREHAATIIHASAVLRLVALALSGVPALAGSAPPARVHSTVTIDNASGPKVEVAVEGPASEKTPLQVACVFEYVPGDITQPQALPAPVNGMLHLDRALGGLITELRKSGQFEGHELETLLLTPPPKAIAAERLLLVGLGDRARFTPQLMIHVGVVGMREALRLGVDRYAHASDLKDAGIDSPTGVIAQNVLRGALKAWHTQQFLEQRGMAPHRSIRTVTLLAGPAFFADTQAAARELLAAPATPAPSN